MEALPADRGRDKSRYVEVGCAGPRRGTGANTSANLLWWPAAAQRTSIFVRGVPTIAEFMQYNTMMLGTSIHINKCWENLIKIGFDHGIV